MNYYLTRSLVIFLLLTALTAHADDNRADALFNAGIDDLNSGRLEQAIEDFTEIIKLDPDTPEAYFNRGAARANIFAGQNPLKRTQTIISGKSDTLQAAIADFSQAITLDPSRFEFYFARGNAYLMLRDGKNAITDMTTALSIQPNRGDILFQRGLARLLSADVKGAWEDIENAKKMGFKPTEQISENLERLRKK